MAKILENRILSPDFSLMRVRCEDQPGMGQFYMVRGWDLYPLLSRPISVYDADKESVAFLYKVVGEGTRLLAGLAAGDEVALQGPYGNGFPILRGKTALVGGGVGIAPLYLTARKLKEADPTGKLHLFLGFSGQPALEDEYRAVCDELHTIVGGFVTDHVEPAAYDQIFCCGPDAMMRALAKKCRKSAVPLYVSLENRMACGLGACLVCTCETTSGNRKVCKDGPVFLAEEVYANG